MIISQSVDSFYTTVNNVFNKIYPLKQIIMKSSDPPFINPFVKSLLVKKMSHEKGKDTPSYINH